MHFRISIQKQSLFRKLITAYIVASILPMLFLGYLFLFRWKNVGSDQISLIFSLGIPSIALLSISGFLLLFHAVRPIRSLSRNAEEALAKIGRQQSTVSTDEIDKLSDSLLTILDELRNKITLLEDYSNRLSQANRKLLEMSTLDDLTGLYNFRYFRARLEEEVGRAGRYGRAVCLIIIDIDDFKAVNDSSGHQAGNEVLRELAALWRYSIRRSDLLARYGGEEFAVILTETDLSGGLNLAEHLRVAVQQHTFLGRDFPGDAVRITASFGVAEYEGAVDSADDLIHAADKSLLIAKKEGKNCVRWASIKGNMPEPLSTSGPPSNNKEHRR